MLMVVRGCRGNRRVTVTITSNRSPTSHSESPPPSSSSSSTIMSACGGGRAANYIEHHVSKMDTLAGVAIKYGVEVADIKKMNALVTDLQMFALKSLRIPLPGRHPPGERSGQTSVCQSYTDAESYQSLSLKSSRLRVSPSMGCLQDFYGLRNSNYKSTFEVSESSLSRHRRSRSLVNVPENGELVDDMPVAEMKNSEVEKSLRRRQKADDDFGFRGTEMLLKEESSTSNGFLAKTGKGLALRTKSVSKNTLPADSDLGWLRPLPVGVANSQDGKVGVRKCSSTSNLQDQDNSDSASLLPSLRWSLKPDLQALSATAIGRPIFDGLPKPISNRRNKAALD